MPAVDVEGSFHGLNMEVTYGMFLNMQEFMKTGKSVDVSTDIRETGGINVIRAFYEFYARRKTICCCGHWIY